LIKVQNLRLDRIGSRRSSHTAGIFGSPFPNWNSKKAITPESFAASLMPKAALPISAFVGRLQKETQNRKTRGARKELHMGSITSLTAGHGAAANASSDVGQAQQQQRQSQPQPVTRGSDTVHVTEAQQVYQLYNQGYEVAQIASTLSLSVAAVNSYLNISSGGG
jgi:hypothetical protein